jgi:hypothetical protein
MTLASFDYQPVYVESALVGRWFTDAYLNRITAIATLEGRGGRPFVEVLLDAVENPPNGTPDAVTGTRFEAAAGLLLSSTPGFEVDSARKRADEQIDLVVCHTPEPLAQIGLEAGLGLVECKSSKDPVTAGELRDFGAKCLFHRVRFGILVARAGTTRGASTFANEQHAELIRRRFQLDGLTLLVLTMAQLRDKCRTLRGVSSGLAADYKKLVFGPVA